MESNILSYYHTKISLCSYSNDPNALKNIKEEFSQKISNFNDYQKLKKDIDNLQWLINFLESRLTLPADAPIETRKIMIKENKELLEIARKRLNELQNEQGIPPLDQKQKKKKKNNKHFHKKIRTFTDEIRIFFILKNINRLLQIFFIKKSPVSKGIYCAAI